MPSVGSCGSRADAFDEVVIVHKPLHAEAIEECTLLCSRRRERVGGIGARARIEHVEVAGGEFLEAGWRGHGGVRLAQPLFEGAFDEQR